ncbi:10547_t:CDS:2, partial [Funneliformis caledonium]
SIKLDNGIAVRIGIDAALAAVKMFDNITSYSSPTTPILKSIVLDPKNQKFVYKIGRQFLMLPAGNPFYKYIIRNAIHILDVWILSGEEERPAYLCKSLQNLSLLISQNDASITQALIPLSASSFTSIYLDANVYFRRYIELLNLVFKDHLFLTITRGIINIEVKVQIFIYQDVLTLYHLIMTKGLIELELETWYLYNHENNTYITFEHSEKDYESNCYVCSDFFCSFN